MKSSRTAMWQGPGARAAIGLILSALVVAASATEPTEGDRVESWEKYVPGSSIKCEGYICEEVLKTLTGPDLSNPEPLLGGTDGIVNKDQFCENLKLGKPAGCDANNPPSSPGIDPNWVGNGCGDGTFKMVFAEAALTFSLPAYTGNLDQPLPGVSFFAACQAHDQCYGMAPAKSWCDDYFHNRMYDACAAANPSYRSGCQGLADLFKHVVVAGGKSAHDAAQQNRMCAAWAKDMEENQCDL